MIIDCISDIHGYEPKLKGGDLLIIAGDLTRNDTAQEYIDLHEWLIELKKYSKIIIVPGNHDNYLQDASIYDFAHLQSGLITYLCDSGTEFEGLNIWGSPWTKSFEGMNPRCKAFVLGTDEELDEKFDIIPQETNILITHSPAYGIYDCVSRMHGELHEWDYTGSKHLRNIAFSLPHLKLHVCGHIHEHGGKVVDLVSSKFVNASHVNKYYEPAHDAVRVEL